MVYLSLYFQNKESKYLSEIVFKELFGGILESQCLILFELVIAEFLRLICDMICKPICNY